MLVFRELKGMWEHIVQPFISRWRNWEEFDFELLQTLQYTVLWFVQDHTKVSIWRRVSHHRYKQVTASSTTKGTEENTWSQRNPVLKKKIWVIFSNFISYFYFLKKTCKNMLDFKNFSKKLITHYESTKLSSKINDWSTCTIILIAN